MANKQKFYQDVEPNPNFPKLEAKTLAFWEQDKTFAKSLAASGKTGEFVFYDGPPFANGLPHYGHLLTGFVKDIFARYQTMLGKKVERRFGWDCHGLPAEMGAEKDLGISGRAAIMKYGIDKFNDKCRTDVMKYAGEWEKYVTRQARWVDFENDYKTMDKSFMEAVMWAFGQLYEKGLVYEAMRVMPYSWAAETPLSNFETRLDNSYRERADKAITVAFELNEATKNLQDALNDIYNPENKSGGENHKGNPFKRYFIWAWTTTPWTLPSNLALAVSNKDEIGYRAFYKDDAVCIASEEFVAKNKEELEKQGYILSFPVCKKWGDNSQSDTSVLYVNGKDLVGLKYKPLFPYFANHKNAFKILPGDFIEEGSGTGVVHIAPGFGEDDFEIAKKNNIELVVPVDSAGKFTAEIPDYKGINVFDANEKIIQRLKEEKKLIKQEQIIHNYPHCWRTDQPLIYKALPSWYVEVTKIKDRMVQLNQKINWIPEHVRDGLMGKWLEGARDWSISRNRFWGAPIPIWRSSTGKLKCVGSIKELEELTKRKLTDLDLHRPYIDEITFTIEGEEYKRVEDVLDCWFESGSMPFASQWEKLKGKKPERADFIVEYSAQTRGWFYTMIVLGVALFDEIPFKNCICHGVVLDDKGQKLSKRLNNYPDPLELFEQYGADALRWFMLSSPIMRGQELHIDKEGKFIRDIIRLHIKPIWNAYNFFTLYANADGIKAEFKTDSANLMDKYILAKCSEAVSKIKTAMDNFDTPDAYKEVENFFEVLNNWYIRRSKERFWKSAHDADKQSAYDTLYTVLHIICRAAAPLLPLTLEEIYKNLTGEESVHLAEFPSYELQSYEEEKLRNSETQKLVTQMDRVRDVCNAALSIRSAANIRVRQPLGKITVISAHEETIKPYEDIIKDELNVKSVYYDSFVAHHGTTVLKLNFSVLGKRLPDKVKQIIPASKKGEWNFIRNPKGQGPDLVKICDEVLLEEEFEIKLEPKDPKTSAPLSTNDALVVLDLNLTPELIAEGLARDVVRLVQQARKDADLNVADRINLTIETTAKIKSFGNYISEQTLATSLKFSKAQGNHLVESELDGEKIKIGISVAS